MTYRGLPPAGKTFPVSQFFLEDAVELSGFALEENSPHARRERDLLTSEEESGRAVDWRRELDVSGCREPPPVTRRDETLPVSLLSQRYSGERWQDGWSAQSDIDVDAPLNPNKQTMGAVSTALLRYETQRGCQC